MGNRIGFVGLVIEDTAQSPKVNAILTQYADLVTGRIGVPDRSRSMAVIGLIVEGTTDRIGALTARLGNVSGVQVKSALTSKEWEKVNSEVIL